MEVKTILPKMCVMLRKTGKYMLPSWLDQILVSTY